MRKLLAGVVVLSLFFQPPPARAGQLDTERRLKDWGPFFVGGEQKIYADTSYEYSWVRIGPRKIYWKLLTNILMCFVRGQLPYLEFNYYQRDRDDDYTVNFGSYFNFKDSSLHARAGFGMNIDYLYRFEGALTYQHRLFNALHGKLGTRYLEYKTGDSFITSPGLVYYFEDHYLAADYNAVLTEGRRVGHSGSLRLNLAVIPGRFYAYGGGAAGERLYDIFELDPSKQGGFILFSGIDVRIFKNLKGRIGYSYSEEKPNFIKQGLDFDLALKF